MILQMTELPMQEFRQSESTLTKEESEVFVVCAEIEAEYFRIR